MSDAERDQALSNLIEQRLMIEREEEALTELALANGHHVIRRRDLDPRAFLMIEA